jgi:hypothetical protein
VGRAAFAAEQQVVGTARTFPKWRRRFAVENFPPGKLRTACLSDST